MRPRYLLLLLAAVAATRAGDLEDPIAPYNVTGYQFAEEVGASRRHLGEDVHAILGVGTPVRAIADGTIFLSRSNRPGYGQYIAISHPGSEPFVSVYGHLSRKSAYPLRGEGSVKKGDVIGYIGSQEENGGWAPHLHFAIYKRAPDGTYHYWGYAPNDTEDDVDVDIDGKHIGGFFTKPSSFQPVRNDPPVYLSFLEGNPRQPGDGRIVTTSSGGLVTLAQPIGLGAATNGVTVTSFLKPTSSFLGTALSIRATNSRCTRQIGLGAGIDGSKTINGIQGFITNHSQFDLTFVVQVLNRQYTGCNFDLDDLAIEKLNLIQQNFVTSTIDAVAFGFGQNNVP